MSTYTPRFTQRLWRSISGKDYFDPRDWRRLSQEKNFYPKSWGRFVAGLGAETPEFPVQRTDDWAEASGASYPFYGIISYPAIKVVSKLWFGWEGYRPSDDKRMEYVRTLNLSTGKYNPAYIAADNNPLEDDDHGNPYGWVIDADGYYYFAYGSHGSDMMIARTTNPGDETSWTELAPVTAGISYPHLHINSLNEMYVFARGGEGGGTNDGMYFNKATILAGALTWGTWTLVCEQPSSFRNYVNNPIQIGDDVWIPMISSDPNNTFRRSLFYIVFNMITQTTRSITNSKSYLVGALPWSTSDLTAHLLVVDQTGLFGMSQANCLSGDGTKIHVVYGQSPTKDGVYTILYRQIIVATGAVSAAEIVGIGCAKLTTDGDPDLIGINAHKFDSVLVADVGSGAVDVYWCADIVNGPLHSYGGDIAKRNRTSGGVWGAQTLVRASTVSNPINGLALILNGDATTRVMMTEMVPWAFLSSGAGASFEATENGFLKGWIYGDAGVWIPPSPGTFQWTDIIAAGFSIEVYDLTDGRCLEYTDSNFNIIDLFNPQRNFHQPTGANRPTYSPVGWDGTLASVDGDGSNDFMSQTTSSGLLISAEQHVFIGAERDTQPVDSTSHRLFTTAVGASGNQPAGIIFATGVTSDGAQTNITASGVGTGNVQAIATGFTAGTKGIISAKFKAGDVRIRFNGNTEVTGGALGTTVQNYKSLFGTTSAANVFNGELAIVVVVHGALRALDDSWRDKIEGKIAWDLGIQANLNAAHPYKLVRP